MSVSDEELEQYFHRYGWRYEKQRHDLFRTGFVGDHGPFEVWVRLAKHWIFFIINPFVMRSEGKQHDIHMVRALLEANQRVNLAKFGLDAEGDVILSVDMPISTFNYSRFDDSMTALSHYADVFYPELNEVLAQNAAMETK